MTRKTLLLLLVLLAPATLRAQAAPALLLPGQALGFDYADADLATYRVTGFQVSWDGQAYDWAILTFVHLADTPPGSTTFRMPPPFTTGTHTAQVRTCNADGGTVGVDLAELQRRIPWYPLPILRAWRPRPASTRRPTPFGQR
jgi:hypothetical protein